MMNPYVVVALGLSAGFFSVLLLVGVVMGVQALSAHILPTLSRKR